MYADRDGSTREGGVRDDDTGKGQGRLLATEDGPGRVPKRPKIYSAVMATLEMIFG